jgi:hypothetical protein
MTLRRKTGSVKNAQSDKIENLAGSVRLSLVMDATGKCKLPAEIEFNI